MIGGHLQLRTGSQCFREEGVFEMVVFEGWVGSCPRNRDGKDELEERWYRRGLGGRKGRCGPASWSAG